MKRTSVLAFVLYALLVSASTLSAEPDAQRTGETKSFPIGAGPLVRVQGGERQFLIPRGYFRERQPSYGGKDSWWLEVLWPEFTPWRENNASDDREFHAPGGGRQLKIVTRFNIPSVETALNRSIRENDDLEIKYPGDPNWPSDTLDKRIKGSPVYGLQPHYADFNRIVAFLNRDRKRTSFEAMTDSEKARWEDWYLTRDAKGAVTTLIRCDSREVADPPDESITGRRIVIVPHCEQQFLLTRYGGYAEVSYRCIYLPHWQAIEVNARDLLAKFEAKIQR